MSKVFGKGVRGITFCSQKVSPDLERSDKKSRAKRQKNSSEATKIYRRKQL